MRWAVAAARHFLRSEPITRFLATVSTVTVVIAVVTSLYAVRLMYWPWTLTEVRSVELLTPVVTTRDVISYRTEVCKWTATPAEVSHSFVDSLVWTTPTISGPSFLGCKTFIRTFDVPDYLPPQQYQLDAQVTVRENALRVETRNYHVGSVTVTR